MPKRNDQLDAEWSRLYSITTELFKVAPWGEYSADSFFSICDEDGDEFFLSFNNGVHCLPGAESLRSYLRMLHHQNDNLLKISLRSIAITRGKDGLEFKSYMPGYVPWTLTDYEVELLTKIYLQAIELLNWINKTKPVINFSNLESPTRRFDIDSGEWINEVREITLKTSAPIVKLIEPPDEMTMFRISEKPHIDAHLEIDAFTVLKQSTEEGYDRPFYPTLIVLAEQVRNVVLDVRLVPPDKEIPEEIIDTIVEFIEKHGKPSSVNVQAQEIYGMLVGFCEEIKLPIKNVRFLSAVNYYKQEKGID